jgi:hypothetical protein
VSYLINATNERLRGVLGSTYNFPITMGIWLKLTSHPNNGNYICSAGNPDFAVAGIGG